MANFGKMGESLRTAGLVAGLSLGALSASTATAQQVNSALSSKYTFGSYSDAVSFAQNNGLVFMHTSSNGHVFVSQDIYNDISSESGIKLTQHSSGLIYILDKKLIDQTNDGQGIIEVDLNIPTDRDSDNTKATPEAPTPEAPTPEAPSIPNRPDVEIPEAPTPEAPTSTPDEGTDEGTDTPTGPTFT